MGKDSDIERISTKLESKLRELEKRKESLNQTVAEVEDMVNTMQGMEFKLRGQIHDIVKGETRMNDKRVKLRKQLSRVEHEIIKLNEALKDLGPGSEKNE